VPSYRSGTFAALLRKCRDAGETGWERVETFVVCVSFAFLDE